MKTGRADGIVRSIVFFAFAIIGTTASVAIGKRIKVLQERIDAFERLKSQIQLRLKDDGKANIAKGSTAIKKDTNIIAAQDQNLEVGDLKGQCFNMDSKNSKNINQVGCETCSSGNCPGVKLDNDFSKFSSFTLPNKVGSTIDLANKGTKDLAKGNGVNKELAELSSSKTRNALKKILKGTQDKANEFLKKEGKPTVDFEKEANDKISQIRSKIKAELSKQNQSTLSKLARALFGADINNSLKKKTGKNNDELDRLRKLKSKRDGVTPTKHDYSSVDYDTSDAKDTKSVQEMRNKALQQYDIQNDDINKNKGVSIFKVISIRYLRSGYPTLLKKRKTSKPKK